MWRACVWSTTVGALRLRVSSSLTMWNPPGLRSTGETSPGFMLRTQLGEHRGQPRGVRQPS